MPMLTSSSFVEESDANEKARISSNSKRQPKKENKSERTLSRTVSINNKISISNLKNCFFVRSKGYVIECSLKFVFYYAV